MRPKGPPKGPWDDEGDFWTKLARDQNQSFTTSSDYYAHEGMGCFLQLIFYCILGFMFYVFISWAIQSDYTPPTKKEVTEGAVSDLKTKHVDELEKLKARHERELEMLKVGVEAEKERDFCIKRRKYPDGTYVNYGADPDDYCPED